MKRRFHSSILVTATLALACLTPLSGCSTLPGGNATTAALTSPTALRAEAAAATSGVIAKFPQAQQPAANLAYAVSTGVHALATAVAETPDQFRASLVARAGGFEPAIKLANAIADRYAAAYPTLVKAASATPYVEAIAAGIEQVAATKS